MYVIIEQYRNKPLSILLHNNYVYLFMSWPSQFPFAYNVVNNIFRSIDFDFFLLSIKTLTQ